MRSGSGTESGEVEEALSISSPPPARRQNVGETVRFMRQYEDSSEITDRNRDYADSWIKQGRHILERASKITDSLCFRHYLEEMKENEYQAFTRIMGIAVPLQAISHTDTGVSGSYWRETKISLKKFIPQVNEVFDRHAEEYGIQTWFVLLNLVEALNEPESPNLLKKYQQLVTRHGNSLTECMQTSIGLQAYAYDLSEQGLIQVTVPQLTPCQRSELDSRGLVYDLLGRLRRGESTTTSELSDTTPSKKPHLWAIARSWNRARHDKPSSILPYSRGVDLDSLFTKLFVADDGDLTEVVVESTDLQTVRRMDDEQIQRKLVSLFESNQLLTQTSRVSLSQEQEKAHAGGEISDFDIEVEIEDGRTPYYVSFPIKSHLEAGTHSVRQLSESNLHQLLRPITRFRKGAVFPILIAGVSLNLQEALKEHRSQFNLPIKFVDEELFTKILKHNGLI